MPQRFSELDLSLPQVMGILNVTPDSFSDGGLHLSVSAALSHAEKMCDEGAVIIDVGGESTRPGAREVGEAEELDRVLPVVEAIARNLPVLVSIDTSKPRVMQQAVAHGAGMINDVFALRAEGALAMAATLGVTVCLMHMQGIPRTMQNAPFYDDVVVDVERFLLERAAVVEAAGIAREQIVLDPGFGFGKTVEQNLTLFNALPRLCALGFPILVGVSRKSMFGKILNREVDQRLHGSVAAAALAAWMGAKIVRAHDVAATVDALRFAAALRQA